MKKFLLLVFVITIFLTGCGSKTGEVLEEDKVEPPIVEGGQSDSEKIYDPKIDHLDLYSVVIDNNPSARPQTGLNKAQRLYELPAEGGITRFLAFYRHESVDKIGPIRSAREDFLDIIKPYDSSFAHCGGSKAALEKIKRELKKDLDEIYNASFAFYRDNARRAPHNLYTSTELLNKGFDRRDFSNVSNYEFIHTLKGDFSNTLHESVSVNYFNSSSYNYKIAYEYDKSKKTYSRLTNGAPHQLTDAKVLEVEGIVFLKARFNTQSNGLVHFQNTGENKAYILYQGKHLETTWSRNSVNEHYKFLIDGNYVEIKNPGFIFQIIPQDKEVKFN